MEKPKTDIKEGNREKGKWGSGAGKENTQGHARLLKGRDWLGRTMSGKRQRGQGGDAHFPCPLSMSGWKLS